MRVVARDVTLEAKPVTLAGDLRVALTKAWPGDGVLLAHAADGVLWGQVRNGSVTLSSDPPTSVGPKLRASTILELRLFDESTELRVFRRDGELKAYRIAEAAGAAYTAVQDCDYELLRKPDAPVADARFVRYEGLAGQLHAPPGDPAPRWLVVRHYFERDAESGLLRIAEHRLLGLKPHKEGPK